MGRPKNPDPVVEIETEATNKEVVTPSAALRIFKETRALKPGEWYGINYMGRRVIKKPALTKDDPARGNRVV
jgi:hypothetical protein